MTVGLLTLVLVPALDQLVKAFLRRTLGARALQLAGAGELRVVQSPIWIHRVSHASTTSLWAFWIVAALALAAWGLFTHGLGWAAGLLLGGSLSHAIETTVRGTISDYICLRFWPAFDLADVALAVGAAGLLLETWPMIRAAIG